MLKGKTVVLGVTGSIAAYKIANLASMLVKQHADVNVIMTHNATNFINPITFETLTGNKCLVDTFDRNFEFKMCIRDRGRADLKDVDDSDLGLKGSPTKIAKASDKVPKGAGEKVNLDPTESVNYLMEKFKEKHII